MASNATFVCGDVVLVRFPFTDQSASKQRPAVVIASDSYNQQRADLVIMAITSQIRASLDFAESLVQDWQAAGLLKPSVVKPVFATIERTLVIKLLGRLSRADQTNLRHSIAACVG